MTGHMATRECATEGHRNIFAFDMPLALLLQICRGALVCAGREAAVHRTARVQAC